MNASQQKVLHLQAALRRAGEAGNQLCALLEAARNMDPSEIEAAAQPLVGLGYLTPVRVEELIRAIAAPVQSAPEPEEAEVEARVGAMEAELEHRRLKHDQVLKIRQEIESMERRRTELREALDRARTQLAVIDEAVRRVQALETRSTS